ncbi:AsmA-like protein [Pseudaminobacter salicylatoxidans]|uniref:AsmA-like protein n=1 Tax=Pseudaminobacter salicylatoxidans TaxID=93369 RepID=A0A316C7E3_PSESE|nr:AsmA family protein [Pseudaminobacter salicylatoxidans]PWJ83967.1 AsmA-like protein [Pseudaminobacter salicylatoxidans]
MLARLFVFVGGLIVLALTAALVAPYFIDWTSYRADFEREASAILGRKVTVEGSATARLLPFPSVTFSDVSVGASAAGEPAMTVETFSMDAELAPFMHGELLIFDMRLVRPRAVIDIAGDGTVDWAMRPSTPMDPRRIALEKLTISDGEVTIRHGAGGRVHRLTGINTEISAKSLAGPWRANGTMLVDGMHTTIAASTGAVDANGQLRVRVKADPELYPFTIETDGNARFENGAGAYAGQFKIIGRSPEKPHRDGEAVKTAGKKPEPGFRLNGAFGLDHQKLSIDSFRFETGPLDNPYTADGTALIELGAAPRFAIEAKGAQVRFDEAVAGGDTGEGLTLAERISALEKALAGLPRPTIPGTVEVNLPAIVAGDTTARDIHLSAEPAEGGWKIKSLAATLPGRTTLEADGFLRTGQEFGFRGALLLAVGQPSGFAAWVASDVDEAIRRLPAAGFSADVDMTENRQSFDNLELVLGDAKFRGRIDSRQPTDMRPSVTLKLDGEALDVEGLSAFASLFVSDKGANRFADRDLDFDIKAGPVSAGGLSADHVDTALRLRGGVLEIDRLSVEGLAGASVSATGRVKDFPDNPTGNLDASVVAVDLAPLVRLAAGHYPDNRLLEGLNARAQAYPGLFEDARIDVVASAAANDDGTTGAALSLQGNAGGSAISATLSAKGLSQMPEKAPLSLSLSARNDDATALMALAGVPSIPLGLTGPGTLTLSARGSAAGGLDTAFSLTGDGFSAKFDGNAVLADEGAEAKGRIAIDAADIEPWMITAGLGLPGMGMGTPLTLAADADYGNGLLVLDNLDGVINEGAVSGAVNAEVKNGVPLLTGALSLDELNLDPALAMVLGEQAIAPTGKGWSSVPFASKPLTPFAANLDLTAGTVSVAGLANAYDAKLRLNLDGEGLRLSDARARLFGGQFAGLFELRNDGGTGLFSGQMKLDGVDLAAALPDSGLVGQGDLAAQLTASGKSVGALVAALSGSGTAGVKKLVVPNVNPDALPALIAKADEVGRDVDAARTAGFGPRIVSAGSFPAGEADIAFTVAGGVLRVPPFSFETPAARLSTDLRADLNDGTVAADGTIAYTPGDEALVGSEPSLRFTVSGPISAPARKLDSGPLAQFLTQRALEREQARVEAMQAEVLEKQRLRREARYYASLQEERERAAEELRRKQEEERLQAEAKARAEAEARAKAEAEAQAKAEAEAKARAAEEAAARQAEKARQEAEARSRAEAEAKARADKARMDAERNSAGQPSEIERAPLPAPSQPAPPAVAPRTFDPDSIEGLLRTLGNGG